MMIQEGVPMSLQYDIKLFQLQTYTPYLEKMRIHNETILKEKLSKVNYYIKSKWFRHEMFDRSYVYVFVYMK